MKNTEMGLVGIVIVVFIALGLLGGGIYYYSNTKSEIAEVSKIPDKNSVEATSSSVSEVGEKFNTASTTIVTAHIDSIVGNNITLDYIEILGGEEAKKAKVADGLCTQIEVDEHNGCFPNGEVYDRNQNSKLRTFTWLLNIQIVTASNFKESPDGITNISMQEFQDMYMAPGPNNNIPYRITLNSKNEVIKIEEIYRP